MLGAIFVAGVSMTRGGGAAQPANSNGESAGRQALATTCAAKIATAPLTNVAAAISETGVRYSMRERLHWVEGV